MNAPLPQNVTSPQSLSALPESWINRLFGRLEGLYGARFHDLWKGTDLENVKAVWAEKLAGFHDRPEVLKAALGACDDKPWPPTLPEFLGFCRNAAGRGEVFTALPEPKMTPEERERNAEKLAKAATALRYAPSTDWAKKLRVKYLSGERLLPIQIDLASGALGEVWALGKVEIKECVAA